MLLRANSSNPIVDISKLRLCIFSKVMIKCFHTCVQFLLLTYHIIL